MAIAFHVIPDWKLRIRSDVERVLTDLTDQIVSDAQTMAPVDTGALRDSIGSQVDGWEAEVYADTPYAAYVELGTSKNHAQPYLSPATLQKRD